MGRQPRPARRRPISLRVWRNPLARRSDRVEAALVLILVVVWLVSLPVVATIGSVRWADAVARSADQLRMLTTVQAVVEQTEPVTPGMAGPPPMSIIAPVSWTGSDGQLATGVVEVPASAGVGDRVPIWLDGAGRVVPAPPSPEALAGLTVFVGAVTWILLGLLMLLVGWGTRRRLDRRRLRAWAQEWAAVEPGRHPF